MYIDYRVARWNIDRGNEFKGFTLEKDMFDEEHMEFVEAFKKENLIDMIDAWADMKFVLEGTKWKLFEKGITGNGHVNDCEEIIDTAERFIENILEKYDPSLSFYAGCDKFFENVVEANMQKGKEKTPEGKIKKPKGFIPPEKRHQQTLKEVYGIEVEL